ncbi:MAG: MMPL family transporter [Chloroflexi bacterium]|nr:MMPL family transporter [Chloroflexota bacterium]
MGITERLARASARRPWLVVAAWVVLVGAGGLFALGIGDVLTTEFVLTNSPESAQADDLIEERLRGPERAEEFLIVQSETLTVDEGAFQDHVEALVAELAVLDEAVEAVTSYYQARDERMVSADRHKTIVPVVLAGKPSEAADNVGPVVAVVEEANGQDGFEVLTVGTGSIARFFNEQSEKDLLRGEMIGIPIALIILILVFGALAAAGVPLLLAAASIIVAVGTTALIGRAFDLNFFVLNMITMVGLAVGIDYSLFVIHRYREERSRGLEKEDAIARTGATAGRAVLFSGGAVIVGLMGLLIVPINVYRSLAIGAIAVAAFAVIAALTLLPAVLSIVGDRINAGRVPFLGPRAQQEGGGGFWYWVASTVMRHPVISLLASAGLLIALTVPYFSINVGLPGVSTFPEDNEVRLAFETLDGEFSSGLLSPAEIAIDAPNVLVPEVLVAIDRLLTSIDGDERFEGAIYETNDAGDLAVISALVRGDPESQEAHDAVSRLRDDYVPAAFNRVAARAFVTGETASEQDMFDTIATYTPIVFAFVLGLSFILLLLVFRSIVVPIKALIMNLLSVGAAYGSLVLVFQHGVGNEIFGFQQSDIIAAWLPLFLFAFLFGLSMDYHVFLLSRIREHWDRTGNNAASVAYGLSSTAGLITGAALIMVAVFSGFAMGELIELQQMGFGLAVAVLIDATIVRSILVPASMALLGDWNWYLPNWLRWLPSLQVEGPSRRAGVPVIVPVFGND